MALRGVPRPLWCRLWTTSASCYWPEQSASYPLRPPGGAHGGELHQQLLMGPLLASSRSSPLASTPVYIHAERERESGQTRRPLLLRNSNGGNKQRQRTTTTATFTTAHCLSRRAAHSDFCAPNTLEYVSVSMCVVAPVGYYFWSLKSDHQCDMVFLSALFNQETFHFHQSCRVRRGRSGRQTDKLFLCVCFSLFLQSNCDQIDRVN